MKLKAVMAGAAGAVALAGVMSVHPAIASANDDGVFTITGTNGQLTPTHPGAVTFADSSTFAGYSGDLVTSVATISGGALDPSGSTNPDSGISSTIANYPAAYNGASETIAFNANQQYFGMLWGSVDASNTIAFYEGSTLIASYTGAELTSNSVGLNAWPAAGGFVDFASDSATDAFDKIILSESATFFETDNYAVIGAVKTGVPEPATWAMMLIGFAGLGAALRGARRTQSTSAA